MAEDRDLAAQLKAGNTEALEQLIMRWRSGAEAYANSVLHDPQAAEDAVQEAFSRIYALRSGLDEKCSFSAYLFTIVRRICIDTLRKQRRSPDLPGELPEPPVESAEAECIRNWERLNRLHLLAALDETDRKLLLAFSLEGKPTKQIAREMNLSDGQVRVRLHRIRRKLKKGLDNDA
ncbi:MAG: sigma-70 family RNA polymerase sigma factor [Clostridia bacterium]|nr:sigma-70 family RNA polymerase sigma factor [Clostridia bacterium]MBR2662364.1 sigma-70 family RNA polymerase sigma factor [Clostridia bacterium]